MARKDIAAGRAKKARGKANDIVGAITGDGRRQAKGKLQKMAGAVQEKFGELSSRRARRGTATGRRT